MVNFVKNKNLICFLPLKVLPDFKSVSEEIYLRIYEDINTHKKGDFLNMKVTFLYELLKLKSYRFINLYFFIIILSSVPLLVNTLTT